MWLARTKNGHLSAHSRKPAYGFYGWYSYDGDNLGLDKSEFPEVTFENSPIKITSLEELKGS